MRLAKLAVLAVFAVVAVTLCAPAVCWAAGEGVYVTDLNGNILKQFDVGTRGALSLESLATAPTGTNPGQVAVSPDGSSCMS